MSDYSCLIGVKAPGCLVDSTTPTINGSGICRDESLTVGVVVRISERLGNYNMIGVSGGKIAGVVIKPFNCGENYSQGDPVSVISRGRVWCLTTLEESPSFGDPVQVDGSGFVCLDGIEVVPGWKFSGEFERLDHGVYIAGVILDSVIVNIHKVKSAEIIAPFDENEPQPNNKPLTLRVNVYPDYATNKTGVWTCYSEDLAEVDQNGNVFPKGVGGLCFIDWTANDGGGATDTCVITFAD